MAATFVDLGSHDAGGMVIHSYQATADAATAVLTFSDVQAGKGPRKLLGITNPVKTTGTAAQLNATYVEATGVLTIGGLTANDVIRFSVMYSS